MSKLRDGMIGPVVILCTICLITTLAMAVTSEIAAPLIEAQRRSPIEVIVFEGMPPPESFVEFTDERLPGEVLEAYMTPDGSHFVVMTRTRGWSGQVIFFVAMDAQGNYVKIIMGDNTETPGIGNRVADPAYLELFYGQNDPFAADAVTGATVTARALWAALGAANEAFELMVSSAPIAP